MRRFAQIEPWLLVLALVPLTVAPALGRDHHEEAMPAESEPAMEVTAEVQAILDNLARTGQQLRSLAEATPAEKYSWAPTDEVRTISEVYMHVVGTNLLLPPALGAAMPAGIEMTGSPFEMMAQWEQTVTDKADVLAKLDSSMEYVTQALASIHDLDTEVTLFGPPAQKRAYFLILLAHAHEHLGQSIAYARSVGVVPPWSQPPPAADDAVEE